MCTYYSLLCLDDFSTMSTRWYTQKLYMYFFQILFELIIIECHISNYIWWCTQFRCSSRFRCDYLVTHLCRFNNLFSWISWYEIHTVHYSNTVQIEVINTAFSLNSLKREDIGTWWLVWGWAVLLHALQFFMNVCTYSCTSQFQLGTVKYTGI